MKERPILFSGPMVRAILDGSKTQTRRPITPQPTQIASASEQAPFWLRQEQPTKAKPGRFVAGPPSHFHFVARGCPAQPGDRLWVRETFVCCRHGERHRGCVEYRADNTHRDSDAPKWRPSIHMPRWASRITLEVTDVRVERLQDITPADAIAEGCFGEGRYATREGVPYPVATFAALWESAYGADSWARNPWVWAISFRRIDAKGGAA